MGFSPFRGAAGAAALAVLASCGGGDGGSGGGGGGTPANSAPRFSSAASASVVENATSAYQATATDADGDALTFTLAGGADAARFTLSSSGLLQFVSPPDFEQPADADGDNVYLVTLSVSDGRLSDTLNLQVTVTNSREGIQVRRVATGFDQPVFVAPVPGERRVFVLEKTGDIWLLDPATGTKAIFMDATLVPDGAGGLVRNFSSAGEGGLLGLAVHPDYVNNGIFVTYSTDRNGDIVVRRFRRIGASAGDPRSQVTILTIPHPQFTNHYGGWMSFGPDGFLYISTGDGGGAGDPLNNSQNTNSRLGKILRASIPVDPFAGASPTFVAPAPGNPFLAGGGDPYVYAYGFRNPFRASFFSGGLIVGDVGQDAVEEIDLLTAADRGGNFGWPFREGTHVFRQGTPPAGLTDPVTEYLHGNGPRQGSTVIGGYVYRGPIASLRDRYVFADFIDGNIWTVPAALLVRGQILSSARFERRNPDFAPETGTIDQIVSFGEDEAGNLYIVDLDGDIFEVTPG
jgi:glucose/arabinose dehydrogenase